MASSVCVGDYDNDGYTIFITYWGSERPLPQQRYGTFTDLTQRAVFVDCAHTVDRRTFVDYDRDGKLDLFVANHLKFDLASTPSLQGRELHLEGSCSQLWTEGLAD